MPVTERVPYEQTEDDYYAEAEALDEGRAVQLILCYLCVPYGTPESQQPLRGVIKEGITNVVQDATTTYTLSCGHTII